MLLDYIQEIQILGCSDLAREEERLPSSFNVGATSDGDEAQPQTVSWRPVWARLEGGQASPVIVCGSHANSASGGVGAAWPALTWTSSLLVQAEVSEVGRK